MILLGLGSNLSSDFGDRFKNIELAISYLELHDIKVLKKSSYYETPSYPDKEKPKFINVVISISSNLKIGDLITILISIESSLGRKRGLKNDPRTCDIDIIDFDSQIMSFKYKNSFFSVPHEKASYRNFVLIPLREIFPDWRHPKTKENISILIDQLSNDDKNSILKVKKS